MGFISRHTAELLNLALLVLLHVPTQDACHKIWIRVAVCVCVCVLRQNSRSLQEKNTAKPQKVPYNKKEIELTTIALRKGCTFFSICRIKSRPSTKNWVQNRQTAVLMFKLTNMCLTIRYFMVKDNDSRHVSEYELILQHCTA